MALELFNQNFEFNVQNLDNFLWMFSGLFIVLFLKDMPQKNRYYGLIGKKIDYSFSKSYFKEKFEKENLNHCFYNNYDLESINDFLKIIEENEISGLNVTIPYKESIINYLDDLDPSAKKLEQLIQ